MKKLFAIALLFSLAVVSLSGQSLYGTGISPESALIRVVFTDENRDLSIDIGTETFLSSAWETSALYHPVSPGMYFFELGEQWIEIIPMSGKYYSLVIAGDQCLVFEDKEHKAPAKNQVYFYNALTDEKATLKVSATGDVLFNDVKPGESVQMAVNPLDIGFSVETDQERSTDLGALPMTRGGSTTVIALERDGNLESIVFQAAVRKEP